MNEKKLKKYQKKKSKRKIWLLLVDDILYEIFHYFPSWFIIKVCMKISRQWRQVAFRIPLSITVPVYHSIFAPPQLIRHLANSECLENMTSLNINRNDIGIEGIKCLVHSNYFKNLTCLKITFYGDGNNCLAKLVANSENLKILTSLNLHCNLDNEGVQFISNSNYLKNLTSLRLNSNKRQCWDYIPRNNIDDEGVKYIANSENFKNLTSLSLKNSKISYRSVEYITNSERLKSLIYLTLNYNNIGTEGAEYKANPEHLKNLTCLTLNENRIWDARVKHIANNEHLNNLTCLELRGNGIGRKGVQYIATSKY